MRIWRGSQKVSHCSFSSSPQRDSEATEEKRQKWAFSLSFLDEKKEDTKKKATVCTERKKNTRWRRHVIQRIVIGWLTCVTLSLALRRLSFVLVFFSRFYAPAVLTIRRRMSRRTHDFSALDSCQKKNWFKNSVLQFMQSVDIAW